MKAAVYYQPGGPEVLRYQEVPDPVPGSPDVLVRRDIHWAVLSCSDAFAG